LPSAIARMDCVVLSSFTIAGMTMLSRRNRDVSLEVAGELERALNSDPVSELACLLDGPRAL
jgi:hypothetical protein